MAEVSAFVDSDNNIRLNGQLAETARKVELKQTVIHQAKHPAVVLIIGPMHEDIQHERPSMLEAWSNNNFGLLAYDMHCASYEPTVEEF